PAIRALLGAIARNGPALRAVEGDLHDDLFGLYRDDRGEWAVRIQCRVVLGLRIARHHELLLLRIEAHLVAAEDPVEWDRGDERVPLLGQIENLDRAVAIADPQLGVVGNDHPVGAVAVVGARLHPWGSARPRLTY